MRDPGCLTGYAKPNYLGDVMLPTQRCASLEDERVRHERQTAAVKSPHWNKQRGRKVLVTEHAHGPSITAVLIQLTRTVEAVGLFAETSDFRNHDLWL